MGPLFWKSQIFEDGHLCWMIHSAHCVSSLNIYYMFSDFHRSVHILYYRIIVSWFINDAWIMFCFVHPLVFFVGHAPIVVGTLTIFMIIVWYCLVLWMEEILHQLPVGKWFTTSNQLVDFFPPEYFHFWGAGATYVRMLPVKRWIVYPYMGGGHHLYTCRNEYIE